MIWARPTNNRLVNPASEQDARAKAAAVGRPSRRAVATVTMPRAPAQPMMRPVVAACGVNRTLHRHRQRDGARAGPVHRVAHWVIHQAGI
jgi:hypothetical protein